MLPFSLSTQNAVITVAHQSMARMRSQSSRQLSAALHRQWDVPLLCCTLAEHSSLLTGSPASTAKKTKSIEIPPFQQAEQEQEQTSVQLITPLLHRVTVFFTSQTNFNCKTASQAIPSNGQCSTQGNLDRDSQNTNVLEMSNLQKKEEEDKHNVSSGHMQLKLTKHPSFCTILAFKYSALSVPPFLIHH